MKTSTGARRRWSGLAVAGSVIGGVLVLGAAPAAANHFCGTTITEDLTLPATQNCTGDGITIGADDVTLDLNGFSIIGNDAGNDIGVRVNGFDGVTITGGTVRDFRNGIAVSNASDVRIDEVNVTSNLANGIGFSNVVDSRITDSSASNNGSGNGITLSNSNRNRVDDNTVNNNGDEGILVEGNDNQIDGNTVNGNADDGIDVSSGSNNLVEENTTNGNGSDGIEVDGGTGTVIDQNTANNNSDDGIDVDIAGTVVSQNTANSNGNLGIEAVAGVIDGGGNEATNNDPPQCTGVVCNA